MAPACQGGTPGGISRHGYVDKVPAGPRQSPGTPCRCRGKTVRLGGAAVVHLVEQFAVPSRL